MASQTTSSRPWGGTRSLRDLAARGDYPSISDSLHRLRSGRDAGDSGVSSHVAAAVEQICDACRETRSEVERLQRDLKLVRLREHELRLELDRLLQLMSDAPERPQAGPTPDAGCDAAGTADPGPADADTTGPGPIAERGLAVYCLGAFRVFQGDRPVEEWRNGKGKAIFKYLIAHRQRPVAKEVLMELLWPDASPGAARNNLNVAIYGLRRALAGGGASCSDILFHQDAYSFDPDLSVWVDHEAFMAHVSAGRACDQRADGAGAIREYGAAETLYRGDFLSEDRYVDWLVPTRQCLQDAYTHVLDRLYDAYNALGDHAACVALGEKMIAHDPCNEVAHRRMMGSYARLGQRHLALRQFHTCVDALRRGLDLRPGARTVELFHQIQRGESFGGSTDDRVRRPAHET